MVNSGTNRFRQSGEADFGTLPKVRRSPLYKATVSLLPSVHYEYRCCSYPIDIFNTSKASHKQDG